MARLAPELNEGNRGAFAVAHARALAETCRERNMRLIPMLMSRPPVVVADNGCLLSKRPECDGSPSVPKATEDYLPKLVPAAPRPQQGRVHLDRRADRRLGADTFTSAWTRSL